MHVVSIARRLVPQEEDSLGVMLCLEDCEDYKLQVRLLGTSQQPGATHVHTRAQGFLSPLLVPNASCVPLIRESSN